MKHIRKVAFIIMCLSLFSCQNKARQKQIENLQAERDSLLLVTHLQDSTKAILDEYVQTIASTLDSIKINEKILTVRVDDNGKALKKSEIKDNLLMLADVLERQRERIEELERQLLLEGVDSTSYYRTILLHLYDQLEEKNDQIQRMQQELDTKTTEVKQLNKQVTTLKNDVESISDQTKQQAAIIEQQTEILEVQNAILNNGYIRIGTKTDLLKAGIIRESLFSVRLNTEALNQSNFDEIDIRYVTEITLLSARPKLLTTHPATSYTLKNQGDCTEFIILDPTSFWSISNYLVIQL